MDHVGQRGPAAALPAPASSARPPDVSLGRSLGRAVTTPTLPRRAGLEYSREEREVLNVAPRRRCPENSTAGPSRT